MNFRIKRAAILSFIISLGICATMLFGAGQALAHQSGCHRWHSCESDSGSYDCGDLGYSSYCSLTEQAPPPPPAINWNQYLSQSYAPEKVEDKVLEESLPNLETAKTIETDDIFVGEKKTSQLPANGIVRRTVRIKSFNGVEMSSEVIRHEVLTAAKQEIILVGTKKKGISRLFQLIGRWIHKQ